MNNFLMTFRDLGPIRLGMMAAVALGLVAFFIYLTTRIATPDMALLYGDLDPQDSGQIVAALDEQKLPYSVNSDGSKIMVQEDQVGRLRVLMAEKGLPSGGSIGYEIFDRGDGMGISNFVQNINHVRALEGELARSIRSIGSIKQARVHLVLPQRQIFSRNEQEPSASIVLVMSGSGSVKSQQVTAIQQMVAAAVPGLKPQKVSIIDQKGNLLARQTEEDSIDQATANSEQMRLSYESRTADMIEDLIGRSLGRENVRAQVSAELDFDRITESSENYDPNGQVVRSTQIVEEETDAQDGQPPAVTVGNNLPDAGLQSLDEGSPSSNRTSRVEETVNFEISKTTKTHIREIGVVRRLSVAVMVNGKISTPDEEGNSSYEPRSAEELEQIATLIRSAVGFDESRGDRIEVVNMAFQDVASDIDFNDGLIFGFEKQDLLRFAEIVVLAGLAILVLIFVVRPMVGRILESDGVGFEGVAGALLPDGTMARPALAGPAGTSAGLNLPPLDDEDRTTSGRQIASGQGATVADEIENMIDLNKVEGRVRASSIRKIGEIIQKHPDEAVSIIRSWLYQES